MFVLGAQANEGYAFTECMYGFISIPISTLVSTTQSWASSVIFVSNKFLQTQGNVDPVKYLTTHRTFMYSGTEGTRLKIAFFLALGNFQNLTFLSDTVVSPTVVEALAAYYQQIGIAASNISTEFTIPSEHCQPTNDYGNSCSYLGSPYIDNCNYDGAGTALQWIYGKLNQPTTPNNNNVRFIEDVTNYYVVLYFRSISLHSQRSISQLHFFSRYWIHLRTQGMPKLHWR